MVVSDVEALRASFCQKGMNAAKRALEMINTHTSEPEAQDRACFYLWQAMDICYHYAQAWQVVIDCALGAHAEMLKTGRWTRWTQYLEMGLEASRRLPDSQAEIKLLLYLGRMQERCGEWAAAHTHLEQAIALADQHGDKIIRGRALTTLSNLERYAGRLDKARRQIMLALETLHDTHDAQSLSEAYRELGNVDLQFGNPADATTAYNQALAYAEACGDVRCMASTYHNLGTICAQHGDSAGAASHYNHALELFRQMGDRAGEALTMASIGLACQADRGYWRQAVETFRQTITICEKIGYYHARLSASSNLVDALIKLGETDQAHQIIERLSVLYTQTRSAYGAACAEHDWGMLALARGDAQAALEHLQRAQSSPELVDDSEEMAPTETDMGRAYAMLGEWDKAEAAYLRALMLWSTFPEWPGELDTWLALVELYRQMGAWDKLQVAVENARALAQKINRDDALAVLEAALGDAHFAANQIQAGRAAYITALRALEQPGENDRKAYYYRRVVNQAQSQIAALERAGQSETAKALQACLAWKKPPAGL